MSEDTYATHQCNSSDVHEKSKTKRKNPDNNCPQNAHKTADGEDTMKHERYNVSHIPKVQFAIRIAGVKGENDLRDITRYPEEQKKVIQQEAMRSKPKYEG